MALDLVSDPLSVIPHLSHLRMATFVRPDACLVQTQGQRGPLTALGLQFYDSGRGGPPVPRPFLGGPQVGFHAMPAVGDDVLVAYQPKLYPTAAISATNRPDLLDVLAPGESLQRHKDGRIADYLKADGSTVLLQDNGNFASLSLSAADVWTMSVRNGLAGLSARTTTLALQEGSVEAQVLDGHGHFGSLKVGNTSVFATSDVVKATPDAGVLNVGAAPFDGSSSGHFAGNAVGTALAVNAPSGFAGTLADFQVFGASKAAISAGGDLTWAGRLLSTSASGFSAATNKATGLTSVTVSGSATRGRLSLLWNTPAVTWAAFSTTRACTMTFSSPYTGVPTVLVSTESGSGLGTFWYSAVNVTANGFDLYFVNPGTSSASPSNNETDVVHFLVVG